MVTAKTPVHTVLYSYDAEDKLTKKRILPADGTEQVIYYEHPDDANEVVKFTAGGRTVTSHSKTDSFGRKVFDELQLGTGFVSRQFSYHAGQITDEHKDNAKLKSTATTQLVSQIVLSDGRTLAYEYDAEERITKVIDSVDGTTEYTYDALGQLLTETRDGVTVNTMTYDNYGNIVTKNGVSYTYGDAAWKDKLTAVGNQSITYDAQGNPTCYLGHALSWEKGRQLKSFENISYTYNANGIRTSKTVDGVKHTYLLDGAKILRETWGSHTLIPLYDNEESVCGIVYNDVPYYFLKNQQGDVIALTDADAQVVAKYRYDAWGVCTVAEDTTEDKVASINPFRYRGYYYDAETELYYLQSRYYDASVGRFVNGDDVGMATLIPKKNIYFANLFDYCYNNSINKKDETGFGGADVLLNALRTAMKLIAGVAELSLAEKKTKKQRKKSRKQTGRSDREIKRSIKKANEETKKMVGNFKTADKIMYAISLILIIYNCVAVTTTVLRLITDSMVEIFIAVLVEKVGDVASLLLKMVPIPGVGFILGFAAGVVIERIFAAVFTAKKTKRIKNAFYSKTSSMVKRKSLNVFEYMGNFIYSLAA